MWPQSKSFSMLRLKLIVIEGWCIWFGKSLDKVLSKFQALYFLYCSLIDGIIDDYDVYKVETIGDGYMIASGLPKRNGNDHAVQIALSALHIVHVVSHYSFPHVTGNGLQIRVGLHSGNFTESDSFEHIYLSFCSGLTSFYHRTTAKLLVLFHFQTRSLLLFPGVKLLCDRCEDKISSIVTTLSRDVLASLNWSELDSLISRVKVRRLSWWIIALNGKRNIQCGRISMGNYLAGK